MVYLYFTTPSIASDGSWIPACENEIARICALIAHRPYAEIIDLFMVPLSRDVLVERLHNRVDILITSA